jgi:DNA polymerase III subunit epsilon
MSMAGRFAVLDFETTGMSPPAGARATEIGIALLEDGRIVDRYQSLMNAGAWIPPFIEDLTGISNALIRKAPPAETVMREAADFVGDLPLVAHNAGFDSRFWDAELARIGRAREAEFACSMLLARRVFPDAPSHKLGTLVDYANLPVTGRFHRAMADAEMAAHLLARICDELAQRFELATVSHELLCRIQRAPRRMMELCVNG